MAALTSYLVEDESTEHVLGCFETGFVSHLEYNLPEPWGHVTNYPPLTSARGKEVLRTAMKKQVLLDKMIGGPG